MKDVETKILITSFGPFGVPSFPDIPGIDDYRGIKFHSSRWRHDVDLSHKRVAVLGIGASAFVLIYSHARHLADNRIPTELSLFPR
jgi:cation diffusion facilitator CzcD-associated flavoprotein CzcO